MNSLSENNSIIASTYQSDFSTLSTTKSNMTTSPTDTITNSSAHSSPTALPDDQDPIRKNVAEIWKNNFNNSKNTSSPITSLPDLNLGSTKSWANINHNNNNNNNDVSSHCEMLDKEKRAVDGVDVDAEDESDTNTSNESGHQVKVEVDPEVDANTSPSHHARRPMNAFLIFCKKHRPIVREKYPTLENRGVTRILGEWWSLLDCKDKNPYTQLAKEYKDAFFTANPNFKWYKLPAPPLRTLPTRPTKSEPQRSNSPQQSTPQVTSSMTKADFTPGKLADESQLGGLSSLLGDCYSKNERTPDNEKFTANEVPPKPLKKRFAGGLGENHIAAESNNRTARNLFNDSQVNEGMEAADDLELIPNGRKSFRKGKGNRYADIMVNGKLIKTKRNSTDKERNLQVGVCELNNKLDLNHTIKRLEERITLQNSNNGNDISNEELNNETCRERTRTESEVSELSDVGDYTKALPSFDLDARITELSNLSYDAYMQRKKEKKRKLPKGKTTARPKRIENERKRPLEEVECVKVEEKQTGSKKRKNKRNITHLGINSMVSNIDLSGLATLAEMAAAKEKIDDTNDPLPNNNNNNNNNDQDIYK